jgi:hypothetical protein
MSHVLVSAVLGGFFLWFPGIGRVEGREMRTEKTLEGDEREPAPSGTGV